MEWGVKCGKDGVVIQLLSLARTRFATVSVEFEIRFVCQINFLSRKAQVKEKTLFRVLRFLKNTLGNFLFLKFFQFPLAHGNVRMLCIASRLKVQNFFDMETRLKVAHLVNPCVSVLPWDYEKGRVV